MKPTPRPPRGASPGAATVYRKGLTDALPVISKVNERLMHIDCLLDIGLFVVEEIDSMAADSPARTKLEHGLEGLFAALKSLNSPALSDLLDVENGFDPEGAA